MSAKNTKVGKLIQSRIDALAVTASVPTDDLDARAAAAYPFSRDPRDRFGIPIQMNQRERAAYIAGVLSERTAHEEAPMTVAEEAAMRRHMHELATRNTALYSALHTVWLESVSGDTVWDTDWLREVIRNAGFEGVWIADDELEMRAVPTAPVPSPAPLPLDPETEGSQS